MTNFLAPTRSSSPCKGCQERKTACHDNCPKDQRGEFGYTAWKIANERANLERKKESEKPFSRIT